MVTDGYRTPTNGYRTGAKGGGLGSSVSVLVTAINGDIHRQWIRSHLINTRSGVVDRNSHESQKLGISKRSRNGGSFGRPRRCSSVKAAARIRPASRLASGQNLSPRHLLLFMR